MGLFPLKGKAGFLGRSRRTLSELQELGRIATVAGMQTLGKLTRTEVVAQTARVFLVPRAQVADLLAHHKNAEIAARFPLTGANPGIVATIFAKDDATRLVELLLGKGPGTVKRFGALEESAVAEMANIALNGCLNAVSAEDSVRFSTGVPEVQYKVKDLAGFLSFTAPDGIDHAVVIETPFREPSRDVSGHVVLVFGIEAVAES